MNFQQLRFVREDVRQNMNLTEVANVLYTSQSVVPKGHPLVGRENITLEQIAEYPIVTYDQDFTGRSHVDQAFASAGAIPDIVLTAIDADVIKTYVELGMGIGIVAAMAYDAKRDTELVALDTQHLFE